MKRKFMKCMGIGSLCLFLLGCSEEQIIVKAGDAERAEVISEEVAGEKRIESDTEQSQETAAKNSEDAVGQEKPELAVHICGAVNQPGVYLLKGTPRVYEGIQKAGGFTEDAARDYLNLALMMEDGMKIIVPTREEVLQWQAEGQETGMAEEKWLQKGENKTAGGQEGKVDLNSADLTELMTLPGIGETRAASIVEYREQQGRFQTIEDVMKVTGIKEAAYEKIKEYITVS